MLHISIDLIDYSVLRGYILEEGGRYALSVQYTA
jgi:hypothetical protein